MLNLLSGDDAPPASDLRPTALVAEPDRLRGALIAAGLEDLGINAVWVAHGDSALDSAEAQSFDVHVVDPSLISARGERVVQALVSEHPGVPLVVSANGRAALRLASARIPVAVVIDLVRVVLGRRHAPAQEGTSPARRGTFDLADTESATAPQ